MSAVAHLWDKLTCLDCPMSPVARWLSHVTSSQVNLVGLLPLGTGSILVRRAEISGLSSSGHLEEISFCWIVQSFQPVDKRSKEFLNFEWLSNYNVRIRCIGAPAIMGVRGWEYSKCRHTESITTDRQPPSIHLSIYPLTGILLYSILARSLWK